MEQLLEAAQNRVCSFRTVQAGLQRRNRRFGRRMCRMPQPHEISQGHPLPTLLPWRLLETMPEIIEQMPHLRTPVQIRLEGTRTLFDVRSKLDDASQCILFCFV